MTRRVSDDPALWAKIINGSVQKILIVHETAAAPAAELRKHPAERTWQRFFSFTDGGALSTKKRVLVNGRRNLRHNASMEGGDGSFEVSDGQDTLAEKWSDFIGAFGM